MVTFLPYQISPLKDPDSAQSGSENILHSTALPDRIAKIFLTDLLFVERIPFVEVRNKYLALATS